MALSQFIRWARPIALLSGPLAIISVALVIASEISSGGSVEAMEGSMTGMLGGVLGLIGAIALLIGLVAVYAYEYDRLTSLGVWGFIVALAGAAMSVGGLWSQVFVVPYLIAEAPQLLEQGAGPVMAGFILSYALLGLGGLVFSIATLRGRAFPRWSSIVAIVGAVLCLAPLPSRYFLFAIAVTAWGAHIRPQETAGVRAGVAATAT
ncbi:MAG: hypothetical protein M3493_10145 [Actinomycetota bacterium]|jgi:hypothetical protein|nr:hypothetical protein [Euzebyaceae bacterium]MDQ3453038.1 hypothetical protein [Actinomycetota bacterium]